MKKKYYELAKYKELFNEIEPLPPKNRNKDQKTKTEGSRNIDRRKHTVMPKKPQE